MVDGDLVAAKLTDLSERIERVRVKRAFVAEAMTPGP